MVISYMTNQAMIIFRTKWKTLYCRACLAITGGIQETSREWLYDELGLHSSV